MIPTDCSICAGIASLPLVRSANEAVFRIARHNGRGDTLFSGAFSYLPVRFPAAQLAIGRDAVQMRELGRLAIHFSYGLRTAVGMRRQVCV
jgi:hypothetical protein